MTTTVTTAVSIRSFSPGSNAVRHHRARWRRGCEREEIPQSPGRGCVSPCRAPPRSPPPHRAPATCLPRQAAADIFCTPPSPSTPQHSPMTCSPSAQSRAGPVSLAAAHGHGEGRPPIKPYFRDGHQVASPGAVSLYQCDVRPPMGACAGACGCVTRTLDHQGAPASARISGLCLLTRAAVGAGAETCGGDGPRA